MQGFLGLRGLATETGKQLEPLFSFHGQNGPEACSWVCGGEVDGETCKLAGSARGKIRGEGRGGENERGWRRNRACLRCSHLSVKVE